MSKKTFMVALVATLLGGFAAQACYCPEENGGEREYPSSYYYDCLDKLIAEQAGLLPGGSSFAAIRYAHFRILAAIYGFDPSAGDIFDNPSLDLTYSYTDFESDNLGVDGDANSLSLAISGNHGDNIIGVGFTRDLIEADTFVDVETMTADIYYGFRISDNFYAGLMGTVTFINTEGGAGDDTQSGYGPFVAGSIDLNDTFSLGGTAAVLRYDAVADDFFLIDLLVDVSASFTDVCGASAYVGYTDAADDDIDFEEYFTAGLDVYYQVTESIGLTAGYETTLGHDDIDDHTFLLSGTLTF
jgi:hypothetical protein